MPHRSLMHHDIQKNISYHNFYLFFPICKRKEFKLFQLLESFKKNVLMHHPSIKKSLAYLKLIHPSWVLGHIYNMKSQFKDGLGSRASTVKKVWGRWWATFETRFFMFSWAKKIYLKKKYPSVRTECDINVIWSLKKRQFLHKILVN